MFGPRQQFIMFSLRILLRWGFYVIVYWQVSGGCVNSNAFIAFSGNLWHDERDRRVRTNHTTVTDLVRH